MNRSPGPTPSSPLITTRATSESVSSRSTRCCMRSVRMSRGRCTPGRSVRISWRPAAGSVATPRIARRVVCGRVETIATWDPTRALTRVDLPTLGRPARPTKPHRVTGTWPRPAITSAWRASISPASVSWSKPQRWRTPWTAASVRSSQCCGQIATSPSSRGPATGPEPSSGKARTSVGRSRSRCSRFSSRIRSESTSSTPRWPSATPAAASAAATAGRSSAGTSARSRVKCRAGRRRRRSAAPACGGRRPRRRSGRRRCPARR